MKITAIVRTWFALLNERLLSDVAYSQIIMQRLIREVHEDVGNQSILFVCLFKLYC